METRLIHFEGHVQGVGFRYNTLQIAMEFEVTGEVRNLPDGRVELIAQGRSDEIESFVEELSKRMKAFIRNSHQRVVEDPPLYSTFQITR